MADYVVDKTKLTMAYGNFVNPTDVTVSTTNITAFVAGFGADNLKYPDPWLLAKTNGISGGAPTIEFDWGGGVTPGCVGIINHNLGTQGYFRVRVEDHTGSWVEYARFDFDDDSDIFIPINNIIGGGTKHRVILDDGGADNDFYIGHIFYGPTATFNTNPPDADFIQSRHAPHVVQHSAGGAKHVAFGGPQQNGTLEISFRRATMADLKFFHGLSNGDLLGFLPPEIGNVASASKQNWGQEPFWGYLIDRVQAPVGPGQMQTGTEGKYDMTLFFEGAV